MELKVMCPRECGDTLTVELSGEAFHNACELGKRVGDALLAHDRVCRILADLREYYDNTDMSKEIIDAEWVEETGPISPE